MLPKLSFLWQSLQSGFSNANSAHEKAMMVDKGRRAGDERKRVIDIIEMKCHHNRKLESPERCHDGQLETLNLESAGSGEKGCI